MFDLRISIGAFFLIVSTILMGFGLIHPVMIPIGKQSFNLDLVWGGVMLLFALVMLALSRLDPERGHSQHKSES
jgi:hypothetical protein